MGFLKSVKKIARELDVTDRTSTLRRGLAEVDPTKLADELKKLDPSGALESAAKPLAEAWKAAHPDVTGTRAEFDDCVVVVAAGLAAWGAKLGVAGGPLGPVIGAALGAGGGVAAGRLACRRVFR